jgi:large subunit ribosomal protein L21
MKDSNEKSEVAIIAVGGKQHLVRVGEKISVNRLEIKEGDTLQEIDLLKKLPVTLKAIAHNLGDKINGIKFRRKVRYTRHYGHRQHLTQLEVIAIGDKKPVVETAVSKAAPSDELKKPSTKAVKKTETKKPAVKKAVTKVKNGK